MQQMAGNMSLLNPFVFNQFGAYGTYAQVITEQVGWPYSSAVCSDGATVATEAEGSRRPVPADA